jgi:signal transduction histidine kinase
MIRAWVGTVAVVIGVALIGLFPSGVTERRGERWTLWAGLVVAILVPLFVLISTPEVPRGLYPNEAEPRLVSPWYQPALAGAGPAVSRVYQLFSAVVVVGIVMLYLRYRRATPDDRRRIRWLLFGMGSAVVVQVLLTAVTWVATPAWSHAAANLLWPLFSLVAVGSLILALVYQGGFGIDRPARRAMVYRTLWLLIGAGCLAAVAVFGMLVATRLPIGPTVLLTAVGAVLVQPVRRWLERLADRWVFGDRLDGYSVLTRFGAAMSASYAPAELLPRLAAAVRHGLGLRWARVALDVTPAPGRTPLMASDGLAPDDSEEPTFTVALIHAGTTFGRIECGPRRDGLLLDEDRRLLEQFAATAATAVHNLHLTAELSARIDVIRRQAAELTASRARVVQAQDAERQRIQRDLHDGVQQDLVAVSAKLALVRERLRRGDRRADESLAELQHDLSRLLVAMREFAHAIHPPVLVDQGLLEAIEAQASRLPLEVIIEADPALRGIRYPSHIEATTWYVVAEALTNAVKHASANRVTVALSQPNGRLAVEIRDDGCGFDSMSARGLGLGGLADRMSIVDGTLHVESQPGHGTTLRADIPLTPTEVTGG